MRKTLMAVAAAALTLAVGAVTAGHAQALPLCGGNNDVKTPPVDCTNSKVFTFGAAQRTVTIVLHVPVGGQGSTVSYTLDKTVPQPFPIRVVSHEGKSGAGGALDSDVSGVFPANSLGPVVLPFTTGCGQIDIKAVYVANGAENGRVGGPYVCATVVPTTTTPTTTATTVPAVVAGETTTTAATAAVVTVAPGPLPATGRDMRGWVVLALVLVVGGLILATRKVRRV